MKRETQHDTHKLPRTLSPRGRSCRSLSAAIETQVRQVVESFLSPVARPVILRSSSLLCVGGVSWVQYLRSRVLRLAKANERSSAPTNNCSVSRHRYFPQSSECFGLSSPRFILRLRPIVRFVQPKCISAANENILATPSRLSWLKFSKDTPCEMSKSAPARKRRAF